jgi:carbon monoxide dehydrogenase subunit G
MDITSRGTIEHPIEAVWAVLSNFADLKAWHPGILTCESEGSGIGSVRRVTLKDGRGATERLDELDEEHHVLVYSVTESVRPATVGLSARITLTEAGADSTSVEWVVSPPESDGLTDDMIEGMRSYYPTRIQNLADAVARKAGQR